MTHPPLVLIHLNQITDSQHWNIHPFLQPEIPTTLAESFKTVGILQPPIVYELTEGKYDIIAGRRRILAAKEICNLTACTCFVVPQKTSPREMLSILFESHRLTPPRLTPMEIACFFNIALQHLSLDELVKTFLSRIASKCNVSTVKKILQLVDLEDEIQRLVHDLVITEGMAYDLLQICPQDRIKLTEIFVEFQMGGGKQKRLFMLLRDICRRQHTSFCLFLERPEITEILKHKEMNNPQKLHHLFSFLQQMSTPTLHADIDFFKSQINRLKLPDSCTVQHSPAFESNEISLIIRFPDMVRFSQIWPEIFGVLERTPVQE